jgi:hypothetical protein
MEDLIVLLPEYQEKVSLIIKQIFEYFHINEPESLSQIFAKLDLQYIFTMVVG